jgi:isoquinoline 1-oxidoreductase
MNISPGLSRRNFFRLAGGGIVIFVGLGPDAVLAQDASRLYPEDFNAYLVIAGNGRVTVFSGKIEMGQGVLTSQAQMVAEELGVDISMVDMVLGDTSKCPWDMGTFGSLTTRMFGPALRAAGAKARQALVSLAATKLGVPEDRLEARDGIISVIDEPQRKLSYGELSRGARIAQLVDKEAALRAASEFRVMGLSPTRLDGVDKVTGAAKYAGDIRIPGMLYARLLRPPAHGAHLLKLDTSGAEALPGTRLVREGDLIAVLHPDTEAAAIALGRVKADWQLPEAKPDTGSIFDHIVNHVADQKNTVDRGNLSAARGNAASLFEATYRKGYVAHAPIETHTALAEVQGGKATVWASTQTPFPTRDSIAQSLGLSQKNVRVITPFVGGGFGGKSAGGQAVEAARLAQITGKPVQVAWTREEEFFYDTFDPAAVVKIVSGLGKDGRISLWDYTVYAAGERGAMLFYDIPNARVRLVGRTSYAPETAGASVHPFAVGPWRAPGANMNVFAVESQIDIMATAARIDPVEFRLRHFAEPRMRKVLQAAADAFGWKVSAAPSKRGFGVACSVDAGTCVATIAEVKVNRATGKVRVLRMVCAQDMGIVVNPIGAKMQIEGGLTMGLGYVLSEEVRFHGGEILDRNFDTYELPRFSWVPRIEAILVKNDDLAPQGGGEPSITTTGAVIANAVFDAIGVRMFQLPMTADRVLQAMASDDRVYAIGADFSVNGGLHMG